jgi:protein-S-isoprenylcysteine O-methyltransferase Ste14
MNTNHLFHLIFALAFFAMILLRLVFHKRAASERQDVELKESNLNMLLRAVIGLGYILALTVYVFYPAWLDWGRFPLPLWARWLGGVVSIGSVLLLWWVQWALDVQFNTTLHIQAEHQLITHGPYRWVRHPMYTTLVLMGLGWLLLTANWFVGGPLVIGLGIIVTGRVPHEEAVLLETFGDQYQEYMERTGRFLPRHLQP